MLTNLLKTVCFGLLFAVLPKFNKKGVFLHILVNVALIDLNSVVSLVWTSIAKLYFWTNVEKREKNTLFFLTFDNLNRTSVFFFSFGKCGLN